MFAFVGLVYSFLFSLWKVQVIENLIFPNMNFSEDGPIQSVEKGTLLSTVSAAVPFKSCRGVAV